MEFSLATLGVELPTVWSGRRRKLAALSHAFSKQVEPSSLSLSSPACSSCDYSVDCNDKLSDHRDSLLVYLEQQACRFTFSFPKNKKFLIYEEDSDYEEGDDNVDDDDDDTASTLSTSLCSSTRSLNTTTSSSSCTKMVTFCKPLVTSVYTRPSTTKEDKYYLHYNEYDYIDFKLEYLTGRGRCRKVSFARDVVTEIQTIHSHEKVSKDQLFYSETELKGFLEEFVQSLNQRL